LTTNPLSLTGPGLHEVYSIQNSSFHKNGWSLECQKVYFLEVLGQGTFACRSLPGCPLGRPQIFLSTPASY